MEKDNTIGEHVFANKISARENGECFFEDVTFPYDQALGPLRQSSVINAHLINFNWWPANFNGNIPDSAEPKVILIMEGSAHFSASNGETRELKPGDVLVQADLKGSAIEVRSGIYGPFRAAHIYLNKGSATKEDILDLPKSDRSLPYVRNISGDDGKSHFQDGVLEYYLKEDSSLATKDILLTKFQYVYAASDLRFDWHNAPQRQIVLPLTGGTQGENSDGSRRLVPAGGVYFGEDITGEGHITRCIDNGIRFSIFAHLA